MVRDTIPLCLKAFKQAVLPYVSHELSDNEVIQTFPDFDGFSFPTPL